MQDDGTRTINNRPKWLLFAVFGLAGVVMVIWGITWFIADYGPEVSKPVPPVPCECSAPKPTPPPALPPTGVSL
jgi:hypothetical protein